MAQGKRARPRTARRAAARAADKLVAQREKLFELEPGARPERPIEVESAALVEPRARSMECPRCAVAFHVGEHKATVVEGVRLREVRVRCPRCGRGRSLWVRIIGGAS